MADAMRDALTEAQKWVGTVPGVIGVGQGRDTIDVWVTMPVELPKRISGVPVRVLETPGFEPQ
jgi:hypothetical protein